MRYEHFNFNSSYANASGTSKQDLAMNEFSKLMGQNKEAVITGLKTAGVNLPYDASPLQITQAVKSNADNPKVKHRLGALILANAEMDEEIMSNFFGKNKAGVSRWKSTFGKGGKVASWFKKKPSVPSATGITTAKKEKKGFLGGIFKRPMVKDANTGEMVKGTSAFGNWFNRNADAIGSIGGSLLGGLFGSKGEQNAVGGAEYYAGQEGGGQVGGQQQRGGNTKKILLIGGAVLVVVVLVVVLARRK